MADVSDGSGTSEHPLDVNQSDFPLRLEALLAIDDPSYGDYLENLLNNCNFQVTRTSSASDAKKLLEEEGEKFDFVLLHGSIITTDIKILSRLISIARNEKKKLVVFLYAGDAKIADRAIRSGAFFCYVKPLTIYNIKQAVGMIKFFRKIKDEKRRF